MADVIHTNSGSGAGFLIGSVLLIVALALFFIYGLPMIRSEGGGGTEINVEVPTPSGTGQ